MARRRLGKIDDLEIEREFEERVEERVEARRRRAPVREISGPGLKSDRKKPKAPLLLRLLAWCGVILFCFVAGYAGTGYLVEKLGLNKPWTTTPASEEAGSPINAGPAGSEGARLDMQKATFSVFYPKDGNLVTENVDVISRTFEDNIQEAVLRILELGGAGDGVDVLHVFRDVDTVYLDISSSFPDFLNQAGRELGTLLINGIVRTMNENFSLTKVRFLVDSKLSGQSTPVDLSAIWQVQR